MPQPPRPHDLSDAIAACQAELIRLGLDRQSPSVMLWIDSRGFQTWDDLGLGSFQALAKFLARCKP
jgi:hypothetical protein